jgi:hypothetical protein
VALLGNRDAHQEWAVTPAHDLGPSWSTCEAALSEAYHLLGERGAPSLGQLLRRGAVVVTFEFSQNLEPVTKLTEKYSSNKILCLAPYMSPGNAKQGTSYEDGRSYLLAKPCNIHTLLDDLAIVYAKLLPSGASV